jgi:lipopolysaccharide biosynthesis glycosyltransferase
MDVLDDQFLWLDSDILALPGWDEIFSYHEPEDNEPIIYAVTDKKIIADREKFPQNLSRHRAMDTYFNAGVFLVNPLKWRAKGYDQVWKEVGANFKELGFMHHDQDILNYVLISDKKIIPSKFNVVVSNPTQIEQNILHFTGGPKPWHLDRNSHKYFSSIEYLKAGGLQGGAFSGKNWLFEFENYKRHEDQLIMFFDEDSELQEMLKTLRTRALRPLMKSIDMFKLILLRLIAKKWL